MTAIRNATRGAVSRGLIAGGATTIPVAWLLVLAVQWVTAAPAIDVITACLSVLVFAAVLITAGCLIGRPGHGDLRAFPDSPEDPGEYLAPMLHGSGRTGNRITAHLGHLGFLPAVTARTLAARKLAATRERACQPRHKAPHLAGRWRAAVRRPRPVSRPERPGPQVAVSPVLERANRLFAEWGIGK